MSANKGKNWYLFGISFSAAKERLNSAEVEVNTKVNPGSAGVNTGSKEEKHIITAEDVAGYPKVKAQINKKKLSCQKAMRRASFTDEKASRQVHIDALLAKRITIGA
ncbi:hypothetical protein Tco_0836223 [Tanacetum coccineum]